MAVADRKLSATAAKRENQRKIMKNNKFALILAALLVSSSVAVGVFAEEPVVMRRI